VALVRHATDRFAALIGATAAVRDLDPSLIEKDYWAVEALRAVHGGFDVTVGEKTVHVQPIFKGGTSLSKAFGLIERFSEDIDLLVPVPAADPKDYSTKARSSLMKAATETVTATLGIDGERAAGRRGVDLHWSYPYDAVTGDPSTFGAEPVVRVELTVMGGENPKTSATMTSMIADHAGTIEGFPDHDDLRPVTIETLAPERTLVEKLAMLHDAASRATPEQPGRLIRAGRHYYDVAMLLRSDAVRAELTADRVAKMAEDADTWSAAGGFPFTPRPEGGFAESPAFNDDALMEVIERSYEVALSWVWGERPKLAECIETVRLHARRL
jgi:hypothetical protein